MSDPSKDAPAPWFNFELDYPGDIEDLYRHYEAVIGPRERLRSEVAPLPVTTAHLPRHLQPDNGTQLPLAPTSGDAPPAEAPPAPPAEAPSVPPAEAHSAPPAEAPSAPPAEAPFAPSANHASFPDFTGAPGIPPLEGLPFGMFSFDFGFQTMDPQAALPHVQRPAPQQIPTAMPFPPQDYVPNMHAHRRTRHHATGQSVPRGSQVPPQAMSRTPRPPPAVPAQPRRHGLRVPQNRFPGSSLSRPRDHFSQLMADASAAEAMGDRKAVESYRAVMRAFGRDPGTGAYTVPNVPPSVPSREASLMSLDSQSFIGQPRQNMTHMRPIREDSLMSLDGNSAAGPSRLPTAPSRQGSLMSIDSGYPAGSSGLSGSPSRQGSSMNIDQRPIAGPSRLRAMPSRGGSLMNIDSNASTSSAGPPLRREDSYMDISHQSIPFPHTQHVPTGSGTFWPSYNGSSTYPPNHHNGSQIYPPHNFLNNFSRPSMAMPMPPTDPHYPHPPYHFNFNYPAAADGAINYGQTYMGNPSFPSFPGCSGQEPSMVTPGNGFINPAPVFEPVISADREEASGQATGRSASWPPSRPPRRTSSTKKKGSSSARSTPPRRSKSKSKPEAPAKAASETKLEMTGPHDCVWDPNCRKRVFKLKDLRIHIRKHNRHDNFGGRKRIQPDSTAPCRRCDRTCRWDTMTRHYMIHARDVIKPRTAKQDSTGESTSPSGEEDYDYDSDDDEDEEEEQEQDEQQEREKEKEEDKDYKPQSNKRGRKDTPPKENPRKRRRYD